MLEERFSLNDQGGVVSGADSILGNISGTLSVSLLDGYEETLYPRVYGSVRAAHKELGVLSLDERQVFVYVCYHGS